jgi:hypothetical protein
MKYSGDPAVVTRTWPRINLQNPSWSDTRTKLFRFRPFYTLLTRRAVRVASWKYSRLVHPLTVVYLRFRIWKWLWDVEYMVSVELKCLPYNPKRYVTLLECRDTTYHSQWIRMNISSYWTKAMNWRSTILVIMKWTRMIQAHKHDNERKASIAGSRALDIVC